MTADPLRLAPLPREGLPPWAEPLLDPRAFWSGRIWYDTTLAHALPPGAEPLAARGVLMCEGKAGDLLTAETIARVFGGGKAVYDHHRPVPHTHTHGPDHHHGH